VIDFTEHSAHSFCVATETEIVLVDGQNIKVKKYRKRAIAVRYNPQTKKWKRLLRTKVTYKDFNGKEQVKNYVIDPYGKNWIIITSDGVLDWFREGERQSKRSNVSESLILRGFFEGGKVITCDESGDPMIRGYTLENDDKNECKEVEEKEEEKSEQDDFVEEESDENESDENESDENESDENESDENDFAEEQSDENDFTLFDEDAYRHDWEIQECLDPSTIHGVGDKIFLVTPYYLSIIRNQKVRILLEKDAREEFEFA
jgi:hypothetical protein